MDQCVQFLSHELSEFIFGWFIQSSLELVLTVHLARREMLIVLENSEVLIVWLRAHTL